MKKTLTSLIVATMTFPTLALALASEPSQQRVDLNEPKSIQKNVKDLEQNLEIKKLLDSKALEQDFLNGVQKLRLGTNSGGGGDDDGIKFQKTIQDALEKLKLRVPEAYKFLKNYQLATFAEKVKVIVVDDALDVAVKGYIQNSVAVNLPETGVILLNRSRLNEIHDTNLMEAIALHEILSLKKLESTGVYSISAKYLSAQGASLKELANSLRVNRIEQIKTLAPQASAHEVLEKLYLEAAESVDFSDIARVAGPEYECSGVLLEQNPGEKIWRVYSPLEKNQVSVFDYITKEAIPEKPSQGPLFPSEAAVAAVVEKKFDIYSSYEYKLSSRSRARISTSVTRNKIEQNADYVGYFGVSSYSVSNQLSVKKNNGLIVYIKKIQSDGYGAVNPEVALGKLKLIGYCYPKSKN